MYLFKLIFLLIFLVANVSSYSIFLLNGGGTIKYAPFNDGCHYQLYLNVRDYSDDGMPNLSSDAPVITKCMEMGNKNGYCRVKVSDEGFAVGFGIINITLASETVFQIPYQCLELDVNKINITLVGGEFYRTSNVAEYEGIVRVDGLDKNSEKHDIIKEVKCFGFDCYLEYLLIGSNYFKLKFKNFYSIESFTAPFHIEIKYLNSNDDEWTLYTISDHMFKSKVENITDFESYPISFEEAYVGGLNLGSSFTFKSINLPFESVYEIVTEGSSSPIALFPIYGTMNSTIYIYHFSSYGGFSLQFFYQNEHNRDEYGSYFFSYYDEIQLNNVFLDTPFNSDRNEQIYTHNFLVNGSYNFKSIEYTLTTREFGNVKIINSPYGFLSGNNTRFYLSSSIINPSFYSELSIESKYAMLSEGSADIETKLNKVEIVKLGGPNFILRVDVSNENGIKYFKAMEDPNRGGGSIICGIECLVKGDIYNGTFEIIVDKSILISQQYFSIFDQSSQYFDMPFNIISNQSYLSVELFEKINELSYELESINVTNTVVANRVYFNFSENVPTDLPITFITQKKSLLQNNLKSFPVVWNSEIKLFQSDFYVDANIYHGELIYGFLYNNYIIDHSTLPKSYQLNVTSENMDNYGPIFKSLERGYNFISSQDTDGRLLGWNIEIEDLHNGFEYGLITVRGLIDSSLYEIEFTASDLISGDSFNGMYQVGFIIYPPCLSQSYVITDVFLNDTMGHYSRYSNDRIPDEFDSFNPFIKYLDNTEIYTIESICESEPNFDITPPELKNLTISPQSIDVGSTDRKITITFVTSDLESYIVPNSYPIVYLSSVGLDILECKSKLVDPTIFPIDMNFEYICEIDLPIGFGYPYGIIVSIYGIINRYNYFRGYSSQELAQLGFPYTITTNYTNIIPLITGNSKMNSNGGDLWIYGRCFDQVDSVNVVYSKIQTPPPQLPPNNKPEEIVKIYSSAILISNIKYTTESYTIQLKKSQGNISSNQYTIKPWIAIPTIRRPVTEPPTPTPTTTPVTEPPTPTPTPTTTPVTKPPTKEPILPTNPPQQCKNNCGGPNKGKCTTNGCACISPYIGLDCSSIVITVPQPKPNSTEPKTSIDIPSNDNDAETSLISFKSIISLVAIREITLNDSVFKTHRFENWISTEINEKTQLYTTTIGGGQGDDINKKTTVNVTIQWFDKESNVSFAGRTFKMNPSSVKYTIELSKYNFNSALNRIQLVMSAQLESTSNDDSICSVNQFGDTSTGDDSNYLKIQVDEHSLYGRLLKRGIIDNREVSISNSILDNEMNAIKTPTKSQSFIGIDIPYYSVSSIIDPDFSVLLDTSSVSDSNESKCKSKPGGLSSAQLAGIIIGSVGFAAVIGISVTYHFVRTKQKKTFEKSIQMKTHKVA
ncbi:hypothetical protein ACTFIU_006585 [Dictyostelium citrinum]